MTRLFLLLALASSAFAAGKVVIEVDATGVARVDKSVEVQIDAAAQPASLVEVSLDGRVIDPAVPFQWDDVLTFIMIGATPADRTRRYELRIGSEPAKPVPTRVLLTHVDSCEGYPAFKITTPRATWYYHKRSSGFASLIDNDGNDWIGYHPSGGFQGNYRGIPNIAPPQFHPGRPEGKKPTRILRQGPLRVTLASETEDGLWRVLWDIYPSHARMTLTKKGDEPYWILYEGTPGGSFDEETDCITESAKITASIPPFLSRLESIQDDAGSTAPGDTTSNMSASSFACLGVSMPRSRPHAIMLGGGSPGIKLSWKLW